MARIVIHTMETNFLKPVKLELQKLVTAQLMPRLEKLVKSSVTAQLTTLVPALGQQVGLLPSRQFSCSASIAPNTSHLRPTRPPWRACAQISADLHDLVSIDKIRGPVTESFRQCFQEMLIPAFQAATQKMFLQIDQTFQKGLEARKPDQAADQNAAALAQLTQQLAQVTQSLGQLSLQVAQLQASMASMPAATVPPAAPETQESSDPLAEIEDLLREQKIEEAMMKVRMPTHPEPDANPKPNYRTPTLDGWVDGWMDKRPNLRTMLVHHGAGSREAGPQSSHMAVRPY